MEKKSESLIITIRQAGIAQLVEHNLAKVGVASSSLVSRSYIKLKPLDPEAFFVSGKLYIPEG